MEWFYSCFRVFPDWFDFRVFLQSELILCHGLLIHLTEVGPWNHCRKLLNISICYTSVSSTTSMLFIPHPSFFLFTVFTSDLSYSFSHSFSFFHPTSSFPSRTKKKKNTPEENTLFHCWALHYDPLKLYTDEIGVLLTLRLWLPRVGPTWLMRRRGLLMSTQRWTVWRMWFGSWNPQP